MTVEYRIGDALEQLEAEPKNSAAFIHLDDAWARPNRNGGFGVSYPTHPFCKDDASLVEGEPGVKTSLTVTQMLDACYDILEPGGVLAVDVDGYLLPKVLDYVRTEWGDHTYAIHQTVALTKDGKPDRSTPGMYGSSGGYSTVLVWKHACPVHESHPCRDYHHLSTATKRQRESYDWGTVKPLATALGWIRTYTSPGDRIIVPCAGTAPVAVAAQREHGDNADVLCVDIEPEAKAAWERRRQDELEYQTGLSAFSN